MTNQEPVPECQDCARGVILSADGSNHIFGENVGDVRPCRFAARSEDLQQVRLFARIMANAINLAFVIYEVRGDALEYAARRSDFNVPHDLLSGRWREIERVAPSTLASAPAGEEGPVMVIDAPHEPRFITSDENSFSVGCSCGKWSYKAELQGETTDEDMRELLARALQSFLNHPKINVGLASTENTFRATSAHKLFMRLQPDLFGACSCGRWQYDDPRLFETAGEAEAAIKGQFLAHIIIAEKEEPSPVNVSRETSPEPDPFEPPAGVEARPSCIAPNCQLNAARSDESDRESPFHRCAECGGPLCFPHASSAPEDHECQGIAHKLALDLEYAEETTPPAHALKIEWLDGNGKSVAFNAATFASATCACGDFKTSRLLDYQKTEEAYRQGIAVEYDAHLGAAHGIGSGEEVKSKKEQIISLYESGVTDIAQIVRKVAARPSYVAQVLQTSGLITGYFDLYTTTAREQNVYTRFFKNVLDFKTVERSRESVKRIGRLYDYFERLGDRAGQHQAMILALTGKNRARWSGKIEESEVFSEWLNSH
jgi:hypothetical protein